MGRQFQRYSLRGKLTKSIGDRASIADSLTSHDTPLAVSLRPSHDTQPTDQSPRESAPPGASPFGTAAVRQRAAYNDIGSNSRTAVSGSRASKSPGLNSASTAPAVAARTPEARTSTLPAATAAAAVRILEPYASASTAVAAATQTPEPRTCTSPVLPVAAASRTPAGRTGASPAAAQPIRTPETRVPRVAYLTPTAKGPRTPGSAMAYRTTSSSPGPNPLTPPSAIRPSPKLGSGRKPVQYQPRGLALLRHTAAASVSGSAAWPGMSPSRSDVVATPDPGMARKINEVMLAEDILAELMARAVELAESGAKRGAKDSVGVTPPRSLLTVVSEVDRGDVECEGTCKVSAPCWRRCVFM
ncbi:hypothetical protein PLESTF_001202100 [Pleodorina starrii]|nr:hypothetical protein PLESTF_001202100 [Pleodorina starrii]